MPSSLYICTMAQTHLQTYVYRHIHTLYIFLKKKDWLFSTASKGREFGNFEFWDLEDRVKRRFRNNLGVIGLGLVLMKRGGGRRRGQSLDAATS